MSANKTLDGRSFGQKLMSGAFIYTLISIVLGFGVGAVALGYLTSHSFPAFPIVGISRPEYMDDVRMAGDLVLSAEEVGALARA